MHLSRILTALVAGGFLQTSQGAILIDDFNTVQTITVTSGGANPKTATSSSAAPFAIGGTRDFIVTRVGGLSTITTSSNPFGGGAFYHESGSATTGSTTIYYDGTADALLDTDGLGGVNLTDVTGLGYAFFFENVLADLGAFIGIRVYSDSGDPLEYSEASTTVPVGGAFTDITVPFSIFTSGPNGPADFSSVGAIEITIGNGSIPSLDFQMDSITIIPESSSTALLLGAGLLAFRRKRR